MKKIFLFLCLLAFYSCIETPKPKEPPIEVAQPVIPDSMFCHTIAGISTTERAVGMRGKFWTNGQEIKIGLIGGTSAQRKYLTDGVFEWAKSVNLKFTYPASGPYDLRVSFATGSGSWSYIGTDCKSIPQTKATTNIGWAGLDVVLHELGHALGMAHEQSSPNSTICWNKETVYAALGGPPNYWSREMVDWNVFRKMTQVEAEATVFDPTSIMQYSIPGAWVCDGKGIAGGKIISALDALFMSQKYPKPVQPPPTGTTVKIPTWQRDSMLSWLSRAKAN